MTEVFPGFTSASSRVMCLDNMALVQFPHTPQLYHRESFLQGEMFCKLLLYSQVAFLYFPHLSVGFNVQPKSIDSEAQPFLHDMDVAAHFSFMESFIHISSVIIPTRVIWSRFQQAIIFLYETINVWGTHTCMKLDRI